jgi:hypothetical protein
MYYLNKQNNKTNVQTDLNKNERGKEELTGERDGKQTNKTE